ncbi:hypothetical protein B0H14DRAFT_2794374 [Mycena olivaceomarginata]|nr:hypothetical protein B0H14DRAFT_2794374 [Mycena olivaceomarginata]
MGVTKLPLSVPLSSRAYIDRMDAGLTSVRGAQEIISMVSSRRIVTKLILGHNELSDDGLRCAIQNLFTSDPEVFALFTATLNTSHVELLSLTTNRNLSDSFVEIFLPILDSPDLREVHLSAIGLTPHAAPHLIAYLSSPRCRLHTLKCNGNTLGFRAVKSIIRAIERHNFSLLTVEFHANHLVGPVSSDNTSEEDDDEETGGPASLDAWKATEAQLRRVLLRNSHLKRETEKDALQLLRYARPLLLSSAGHATNTRCSNCSCSEAPSAIVSDPTSEHTQFRFRSLPTELQLYIMSFLAPTLSPAQRIRIYTYASSPATLPRAGLCLPGFPGRVSSSACVLDPASMPFGMPSGGGCVGGKCAGSRNSVMCHKEQQRVEWLSAVDCSAYDPHREGETVPV